MIFQTTWKLILSGEKTVTRRVCQPGERLLKFAEGLTIDQAGNGFDRRKWVVGRTYAVQPGRGKTNLYLHQHLPSEWHSIHDTGAPEFGSTIEQAKRVYGDNWRQVMTTHPYRWYVARIRLLAIHQERLQDITEIGAIAEGCKGTFNNADEMVLTPVEQYQLLWAALHHVSREQWSANPLCWVLQFELMKGDSR